MHAHDTCLSIVIPSLGECSATAGESEHMDHGSVMHIEHPVCILKSHTLSGTLRLSFNLRRSTTVPFFCDLRLAACDILTHQILCPPHILISYQGYHISLFRYHSASLTFSACAPSQVFVRSMLEKAIATSIWKWHAKTRRPYA